MKRSKMIKIIKDCDDSMPRWQADFILKEIELAGMRLVDEGEAVEWEPEEGWDEYLKEQELKDSARDFEVKDPQTRGEAMARDFLLGLSFEEIASLYEVTRERVRQCVAKARRKYKKESK